MRSTPSSSMPCTISSRRMRLAGCSFQFFPATSCSDSTASSQG
jgi:hypothetical protein